MDDYDCFYQDNKQIRELYPESKIPPCLKQCPVNKNKVCLRQEFCEWSKMITELSNS